MLFSKKKNFALIERQIKEEIRDGDKTVLKINLRYPELQCAKNDPMIRFAKPFYEKLSKGFSEYAKTELFKKAKTTVKEGGLPFSALMKFEKSYENEKYLSILIEISVSDGISPPKIERKAQTWNRKNGLLCKATDFANEKTVAELKREYKGRFDKNLFLLRDDGIEFIIENERHLISTTVTI